MAVKAKYCCLMPCKKLAAKKSLKSRRNVKGVNSNNINIKSLTIETNNFESKIEERQNKDEKQF